VDQNGEVIPNETGIWVRTKDTQGGEDHV